MTDDDGNARLLAHTAWLQTLARSVVARSDVAAEVAQETLVVAWRRGLTGVHDVRAFLATILRRIAGRRAAAAGRRTLREAQLPPREPSPAAVDVVAKAAMQREVVDAVLRLAEPYRTTVLLRWLEERPVEQIAAQLAVPVETVRTRCRRGLLLLRDDLDRRHGGARAWAVPVLGITGFDEAIAAGAPAAATGAALAAAGAGAVAMGAQTKVLSGLVVVAAGLVAWRAWPDPAPSVVAPPAARAPAALVAAPLPAPPRDEARTAARTAAPAAPSPEVDAGAAAAPLPVWRAHGRVVDETTNAGVRGATVRFTPGSNGRVAGGAGPVTSGDDGAFAFDFERLNPGFVELVVEHPEYGATHVPLLEIVGRVAPGGARDAAIGDVPLARGARIGGRVLAADGATPVAGARVLRYRATYGAPMRFFADAVEVARSGADGRFTLPARVAPGYRREWLAAVTGDGIGWRELRPSRRAHDDHDCDVVLRPMAVLTLRVIDRDDAAIAGAVASAHPACEPLGSRFDRATSACDGTPPFLLATSGGDGSVSLAVPVGDDGMQFGEPVPGGRCTVRVAHVGHRRWQQQLDLRAGERRELEVRLVRGETVAAVGRVLDGAGAPIARATVRSGERQALTDATGAFRVDGIDALPGTFELAATAAGFVAATRTVDCSGPGDEVAVELRLAPARTWRGVVVDQDGVAVAGARVASGRGVDTYSGEDGRFTLAGVGHDDTRVVVQPVRQADEFAIVVMPLPPVSAEPPELRLEVQRQRAGTRVEVALVDRGSGRALEPVQCALVAVTDGSKALVARPMQVRDGVCHDARVPAGRYRIEAETRDGRRGAREVEIAPGTAVVREQLLLDAPGIVRCRVDVAALGTPPGHTTIALAPGAAGRLRVVGRAGAPSIGEHAAALALASERELEIVVATPGQQIVVRALDEHVIGEVAVTVAAGERADVVLRLEPSFALTVATRAPAPFDSLLVQWQRADGSWSAPQQLFGCRGRTELGAVRVPGGSVAWRVGYRVDGGAQVRREGTAAAGVGLAPRAIVE